MKKTNAYIENKKAMGDERRKKYIDLFEEAHLTGLPELNHPMNKLKYRINTPLPYEAIGKELGVKYSNMTNKDELKEYRDNKRDELREKTAMLAERNLSGAFDNENIEAKDRARLALDYLKATDAHYGKNEGKVVVNFRELPLGENFEEMKKEVMLELGIE